MAVELVQTPLLALSAEAVVNRTNMGLQYVAGPEGSLFDAAGKLPLQRALCAIGTCNVGEAVVTEGFGLKSKYIIHTVPPRWCGGKHGEDGLLASCYKSVLSLAEQLEVSSVAIPFLSENRCGYPKERGLAVAKKALYTYPYRKDMTVYLVLPESEAG
ncbi:MAG: macro domain-containing protein [Clostridia bacterium]|nr:macro domain-containing protein [Clostridia bacterium]MBQ4322622.1 macro domain-containing protein [Clostridia bacterium]